MTTVDIGIFAHNEQDTIGPFLNSLVGQTVFDDSAVNLQVYVLANGCRDDTVGQARAALAGFDPDISGRVTLNDLESPGKSRTMHRYIHEISRREADILCFMDADIVLPQADTLARMIAALQERPALQTFTSRPVKDIEHSQIPTGIIGKIIAASGGGLSDYRTAICGQLFMMRSPMARQIGLPAGLPVEDGFMRAMMLTDLLSNAEDFSRIDGDPEVFHVYESLRSIPALIRHQTRIVVGSAINSVLFAKIRRDAPNLPAAHDMLMQAAKDDGWLGQVLKQDLPKWPHGYVPFHFLVWRLQAFWARPEWRLRRIVLLIAGFGFDAVVYVFATARMLTRPVAGFW